MPPPNEAAPPGGGAATRQVIGKVTVEVADQKNNCILWGPTQERLRGRWSWASASPGETSEAGLTKMPTIPGLFITVDPKARTATITDPLGFEENKDLLNRVSNVHKEIFGTTVVPVPTVQRHNLSKDEIVTWLYWLGRHLSNGQVVEQVGKVPTLRELADAYPDAKIQRHFFDSGMYRAEKLSALSPVADVAAHEG